MNFETRQKAALDAAQRQAIFRYNANNENGWVTMREACAIMRCGKDKLYRHIREKPDGFPTLIRFGGTNLFRREDIDTWMASRALW